MNAYENIANYNWYWYIYQLYVVKMREIAIFITATNLVCKHTEIFIHILHKGYIQPYIHFLLFIQDIIIINLWMLDKTVQST